VLPSGRGDSGVGIRPGLRIGRYEVLSAIGAGGMGEVWKARDTTLDRDVAIKALPERVSRDADRVRRLQREAHLLAALNHPNIAVIHGVEAWGETRVLVLEFVDGITLAERLIRGALPVSEALALALQIADSVEAAHDKGIIHRDLKPANIKVTSDGRIKVLDFGIAKTVETAGPGEPHETTTLTEPGAVIGTPSHMAPEQVRGEAADSQADIWAFGVVLYEMLSGHAPFRGPTSADTLARVLESDPDYTQLPGETPLAVRRLIQRCLEKDRRRRFQHMGDVRLEIEDALAAPRQTTVTVPGPSSRLRTVYVAAAAVLLIGASIAGWFVGQGARSTRTATPTILSIPFVEPSVSGAHRPRNLTISSDGSRIAYASPTRLWIRQMDRKDPIAIAGSATTTPFFSPDGQWVGFHSGELGKPALVKVPVRGGTPVTIAVHSDRPGGATWGADGTIVFATTEGLYRVSANGGESTLLIKPNPAKKERLYAWPHFLPDSRSVLYTIVSAAEGASTRIALLNLSTLTSTEVIADGTSPVYLRSGELVYASGSTLKSVAFDPSTGRTQGDPVVVPDAAVQFRPDTGATDFAVSQSGTLVYLPFSDQNPSGSLRNLAWIDREGREELIPISPANIGYPRISPDATQVALDMTTAGGRDIWILHLDRLSLTQLTDGAGEDMLPVWSPDGRRVFFTSDRSGNFDVYSQPADGAAGAQLEFAGPGVQVAQGFAPEGLLVYENFHDTLLLRFARPDRLEPLLHSEFDQRLSSVSPDGRWILYESNESGGRFEVFVRPFPDTSGRREQVSIAGGRYPRWYRSGRSEITYVDLDGKMMAVPVTLSPTLSVGRPVRLFQSAKPPAVRTGSPYDISPRDGRFLVTKPVAENSSAMTQVSVVLNFLDRPVARTPRQ
jgi:serine/threonine protein kinase/Tol biopolymer transport system component